MSYQTMSLYVRVQRAARRRLQKAARRRVGHIRRSTPKLDPLAAMLLHVEPLPCGDAFPLVHGPARQANQVVRRLNARAGTMRGNPGDAAVVDDLSVDPLPVPTRTLLPAAGFGIPRMIGVIRGDLELFTRHILHDEYRADAGQRYRCPRHPSEAPTVTLLEGERGALVHCSRCRYRWTPLDLIAGMFLEQGRTWDAARQLWPDKVASGVLDEAEILRAEESYLRAVWLERARGSHRALVVAGRVRPAFGDWAACSHDGLMTFLCRERMPAPLTRELYLLQVLRDAAGQVVAVDVYSRHHRPLFRHWMVAVDDPDTASLFRVPAWGERCDPARGTVVCAGVPEARVAEAHTRPLPPGDRRRIVVPVTNHA